MKKIIYPSLKNNEITIGVTAPSSGVEEQLKILMTEAKNNVHRLGIDVVFGETVWTQYKGRSASIKERVTELETFLKRDDIHIIMPPWGGSFLMEILPHLNWEAIKNTSPKWMIGYSDISTLLFVYTTKTGIATAHGLNFSELSTPSLDETSSSWLDILKCHEGDTTVQLSSENYQSSWNFVFTNPAKGFYLDTPTNWKTMNGLFADEMQGRLLGGCLNTLQILIGTPYDHVKSFIQEYCPEGTIFYLEPVNMNAAQIYRALWQMKQAGWFEKCNGILFGRADGYNSLGDFTLLDALQDTFSDLTIPVFYDVDVGHMPPQLTLVNGAMAEIYLNKNKGKLRMTFN